MRRRTALAPASLLAAVLALAACGDPGSGGGTEPTAPPAQTGEASPDETAQDCLPVADERLVVLEDDQLLQTADNVIPAVHEASVADDDAILAVLDEVSAALDTDRLIELNRAVDVDRQTSTQVAAAFLTEEGLDERESVGDGRSIVVGAANFSENETLAELYAGALRAAGYDATTQTIGNRETYLPTLLSGEITVAPEYAGTLTEFLNVRANGPDAEAVASGEIDATVVELERLGAEEGLVFGTPSAAQDQNAFAVTVAFAEEYGVSTLSELAEVCGALTLGGPPECPERPFCQPGLEETYGLDIGQFVALDAGGPLTKAGLQQGEIALGLVFSSDAALATD